MEMEFINNNENKELVTVTKKRMEELLQYERFAMWVLNGVIISSLPDIELTSEIYKDAPIEEKKKVFGEILRAFNR